MTPTDEPEVRLSRRRQAETRLRERLKSEGVSEVEIAAAVYRVQSAFAIGDLWSSILGAK